MLEQVNLKQPQYHTAEMIISVAKSGGRIVESDRCESRTHGSSKKGRDLLYGFKFLQRFRRGSVGNPMAALDFLFSEASNADVNKVRPFEKRGHSARGRPVVRGRSGQS